MDISAKSVFFLLPNTDLADEADYRAYSKRH